MPSSPISRARLTCVTSPRFPRFQSVIPTLIGKGSAPSARVSPDTATDAIAACLTKSLRFISMVYLHSSVGHCVNNDVDAYSIGGQPILDGVTPVVYPFPCVTQVAVTGDEREELAVLVLYAHIVRDYP